MATTADSRAREVLKMGDIQFARKKTIDSLWQELALQFQTDRADYTTKRNEGEEFADHLFASYPGLAARELSNMFASHLRPQGRKWFSIHVDDEELDERADVRAYLEYMTDVQWASMYDSRAGFVKATKMADRDFAITGNSIIHCRPNADRNGVLYTCYHLRDNAWSENAEGVIDVNHRNWSPSARQLKALFPDRISPAVQRFCESAPETTIKCRHSVMPSRVYEYKGKLGKSYPFVSLIVECDTETVLEEVGLNYFPYIVSRWMTVSGSPFGRSMATEIALPDSRTLQVVTRTLREAAEKFVDPPMIAVADAIRGDLALYAGGVTTADAEYDERLGEVLRPLTQDKGGMPIGFEIAEAIRSDIRQAFFLDKIQLPEINAKMTAFEVQRRISEMIRAQSPIFEPIEKETNTPLCEKTFELLMGMGHFDLEAMPRELGGRDFRYRFSSPLSDLAEANEAEIYKDVMANIWMPAAQIDRAQLANIDLTRASRDAARAAGWKAKWFKSEEEVEAEQERQAQMAEAMEAAEGIGMAGSVAEQVGKGGQAIMGAMNGGG